MEGFMFCDLYDYLLTISYIWELDMAVEKWARSAFTNGWFLKFLII